MQNKIYIRFSLSNTLSFRDSQLEWFLSLAYTKRNLNLAELQCNVKNTEALHKLQYVKYS